MYDSKTHFDTTYRAFTPEFRFEAKTPQDVEAWQKAFRPRLRTILGLDNMEADLRNHRPTAERIESVDRGDHIRESWHLWTEPTVPLPFYLLLPKRIEGRLPLVLTPHGHNHPGLYAGVTSNPEEEKSLREGDRGIAVQAVQEGYIALAPTTRAFGETRTPEAKEKNATNSCEIQLRHGLLVGRTPIGERVWDMIRLIDWATEALPVDPTRIAMTGNSGGGTVTLFAAACDTRIAFAMPGSYFCTFKGSIGSIASCDCNYIPGILRLGEMSDVAGLIAPRFFRAIAGQLDPIFPIDQVQVAYEQLEHIYTVAGVPERCSLYIGEGGHRFYKDGAWERVRAAFEQE